MRSQDGNNEEMEHVIRAAFAGIDEGLTPPAFHQLWNEAGKAFAFKEKQLPGKWQLLINALARPVPAFIVITCLVFFILFITVSNDAALEDQELEHFLASNEYNKTLNPESLWYGETDELLDIPILMYEEQYPAFAHYNPVSMEIRE